MNDEIVYISQIGDPNRIQLEEIVIRPRRNDMTIEDVALVWMPVVQ